MPFEKIPAILLVGLGLNLSLTAPTAPTPKNERRMIDSLLDVNWMLWVLKAGYWVHAIIELCIVVAGTQSNGVANFLLPNGKLPECIKLTPTAAFATVLMVGGALLRYWCFREMGRQFTFHVTLINDHKLITTGPYSVVRHPAYTGGLLILIGKVMWYTAQGSWLRESMVYQMKVSWLIIVPVVFSLCLGFLSIIRRIPVEEAVLGKEFGKEWEKWERAVPYRLFPGIL